MTHVAGLAGLGRQLAEADGTVSVWCGRLGAGPACAREPDVPHYAASTIKLGLLVAAYRLHERGELDLDAPVRVHDDFDSVVRGRFAMPRDYDNDELPWQRLGSDVPLRWLAARMIVSSSNLATDLVFERIGTTEVTALLAAARADGVVLRRPICDDAAADAGVQNLVTAAGLAALMSALALGRLAAAGSSREMLEVLRAQEHREGIAAGLPPDTALASKGGWVEGVRHDVALVEPADAPAYVLAVCTTGLADETGLAVLREVAAASWADRHALDAGELT